VVRIASLACAACLAATVAACGFTTSHAQDTAGMWQYPANAFKGGTEFAVDREACETEIRAGHGASRDVAGPDAKELMEQCLRKRGWVRFHLN